MIIDYKKFVRVIELCTNKLCENKCKRYYKNCQPSNFQIYINPNLKNKKKCKIRLN